MHWLQSYSLAHLISTAEQQTGNCCLNSLYLGTSWSLSLILNAVVLKILIVIWYEQTMVIHHRCVKNIVEFVILQILFLSNFALSCIIVITV